MKNIHRLRERDENAFSKMPNCRYDGKCGLSKYTFRHDGRRIRSHPKYRTAPYVFSLSKIHVLHIRCSIKTVLRPYIYCGSQRRRYAAQHISNSSLEVHGNPPASPPSNWQIFVISIISPRCITQLNVHRMTSMCVVLTSSSLLMPTHRACSAPPASCMCT